MRPNGRRHVLSVSSTYDEGWKQIEVEAVDKIKSAFEKNVAYDTKEGRPRRLFSCAEIIRAKTIVYDLVSYDAHETYLRFVDIYDKWLPLSVLQRLIDAKKGGSRGGGSVALLREFLRAWRENEIITFWLAKFFSYMERWYIRHEKVPDLRQVSINAFKSIVYDVVREEITYVILALIGNERRRGVVIGRAAAADGTDDIADAVDKNDAESLIKRGIEVYEALGGVIGKGAERPTTLYQTDFESPLLDSTREYYSARHREWKPTLSNSEYLAYAYAAFVTEENIASKYPNESTAPKITSILKEKLLRGMRSVYFDSDGSIVRSMIDRDAFDDLKHLYSIFSDDCGCLEQMERAYIDFVATVGKMCHTKRTLDAFHNKCLILVGRCFDANSSLFAAFWDYYLHRYTNSDAVRVVKEFCGPTMPLWSLSSTSSQQSLDQ